MSLPLPPTLLLLLLVVDFHKLCLPFHFYFPTTCFGRNTVRHTITISPRRACAQDMPTLFRHFATNLCSKFCLCLLSPDKRHQRRQPTSIRAAHIYPKQPKHFMASDQLCELRAGTSVQVRHWHHFVTYLSSFSILFAFGGRDT